MTAIPKSRLSPIEELLDIHMRAAKLPEPVREFVFAPSRKFRFDFCWEAQKIAVECDGGTRSGGRHTTGDGFEKDCQKINLATLMGYRVFRFTGKMVRSGEALQTIEKALEAV